MLSDDERQLAVVEALKGVVKNDQEYGPLYPTWNVANGTHSGVIVLDAAEIINVCGMVVQHDRSAIRHLVPPREKIWNHSLLTATEIRALMAPTYPPS
jgi:hypothetical protein